MPKKLERCVEKVISKRGKYNPYAVCYSSIYKKNKVKKQIKEFIDEEKEAQEDYKKLIKNLKSKGDKDLVRSIARQEKEHSKKLKTLLKKR